MQLLQVHVPACTRVEDVRRAQEALSCVSRACDFGTAMMQTVERALEELQNILFKTTRGDALRLAADVVVERAVIMVLEAAE